MGCNVLTQAHANHTKPRRVFGVHCAYLLSLQRAFECLPSPVAAWGPLRADSALLPHTAGATPGAGGCLTSSPCRRGAHACSVASGRWCSWKGLSPRMGVQGCLEVAKAVWGEPQTAVGLHAGRRNTRVCGAILCGLGLTSEEPSRAAPSQCACGALVQCLVSILHQKSTHAVAVTRLPRWMLCAAAAGWRL